MARIAIAGFRHATNGSSPMLTRWEDFERGCCCPPFAEGEALFGAVQGHNAALAGFLDAGVGAGHDLVPILWASALSSGPIVGDVYEEISERLLDGITSAPPLDAVYLSLHGAMIAEHVEDGEGELLRRLRDRLGPLVPIVASIEYHADVSAAMVRHATALVGCRNYPQLDGREAGVRSLGLLDGILRSGRPPAKAWRQLDFVVPFPWSSTLREPASSVMRLLDRLERPGVDWLTFAAGFPAADVPDCGPSVLGYGTDASIGADVQALAGEVASHEAEWTGTLLDSDRAVRAAMLRAPTAKGPVILAGVQDDPAAGGTADTMGLLKALLGQGVEDATVGLVYAPHVATIAHRSGEGAEIHVSLGGKHGIQGDSPLDGSFRVEALCDGQVDCASAFQGGGRMDLSPMACLRIGGVRVVVVGQRVQAAERAMFRAVGIEPADEEVVALKTELQLHPGFEQISDHIVPVEAPGAAIADPGRLAFLRLRPGVRRGPCDPSSAISREDF